MAIIVGGMAGIGAAAACIALASAARDSVQAKKRRRAAVVMEELGPYFLSEGYTVPDLWYCFERDLKSRKIHRKKVRKYNDDQWQHLMNELNYSSAQKFLLTRTWRDEKKNRHLRTVSYLSAAPSARACAPSQSSLPGGVCPIAPGSRCAIPEPCVQNPAAVSHHPDVDSDLASEECSASGDDASRPLRPRQVPSRGTVAGSRPPTHVGSIPVATHSRGTRSSPAGAPGRSRPCTTGSRSPGSVDGPPPVSTTASHLPGTFARQAASPASGACQQAAAEDDEW
eukprot:TRINITY_DN3891_c0_g1_i1.p1 TRINITY_DN3891_c0_g1~~TRINITY_DN3891_c0_g1_i1.p1  ORF type:complete len:320 (-),score=24.33 TRINITY_DN3891_c0_g1_i1:466-1314(-)